MDRGSQLDEEDEEDDDRRRTTRGGGEEEEDEEEEEDQATDIKSNNPHLAGGEKSGSVSKPCTPGEHQNSW